MVVSITISSSWCPWVWASLPRPYWRFSSIPRRKTRYLKRFPSLLPETRVWLISVAVLGLFAAVITAASAQEPMADDDLARREELALEMAGTLDRAGQSSPDSDVRQRRWSEAIELLDWFLKENPD